MSLHGRLPDALASLLSDDTDQQPCGCEPSFEGETLIVDASACDRDGRLADSPDCRQTVIGRLVDRDAEAVKVERRGVVRAYEDKSAALLAAAGRFAEATEFHDERLAARALRDPLAAAHEATGRADAVRDIAAETGLAELAANAADYETVLAPAVGPTVSHWRVCTTPPPDTQLRDVCELDTGATVRRYEQPTGVDRYFLWPAERDLSAEGYDLLATAYDRLASGAFEGEQRAPGRAVRAVAEDEAYAETVSVERISGILRKHTRGFGLLEDLFADPEVSDAFVTAPAPSNQVRVTVDGETCRTNVRLTAEGVEALSSRFRRESGRAFSRADPTLDATATVADRQMRVAGVTEPPSDGTAFAFRAQDDAVWTLPALVGNGTLSATAAALLSVAVERGAAVLVAGPRGAGKTTLLGALLWELPPDVRTVAIEDTPELPVEPLQEAGRDIQPLLASADGDELSPAGALRTALRLGDGAIAVGEVRGEEAGVLYEAMRVGANSEAVLGTIHGDGGQAVYERVVEDLGVSPSSFGVTDLIVTCEITADSTRRVSAVEEVTTGTAPAFETLFERSGAGLDPTGRIERGNSTAVDDLRAAGEPYADLRERLKRRERLLQSLADAGGTDVGAVVDSHGERER
ncbi:type II secretion protein [Halovenus sp. WSH3]|uniref:Type II secretion protein n=1 Tax=Halovenus carboxidivorans TaxID=2692199 RepID=A0A6B0T2L9_9EURY|nr:type II/IV secretion system ATPase subunit [Halovenus carboxidivorans]MXR52225.1 type II secretion protein [Halovenus carboxidivorans]